MSKRCQECRKNAEYKIIDALYEEHYLCHRCKERLIKTSHDLTVIRLEW